MTNKNAPYWRTVRVHRHFVTRKSQGRRTYQVVHCTTVVFFLCTAERT